MSGSTMMLVTATLPPPSWAAMLPQKFSAAARSMRLPGPPVEDSAERPHPTVTATSVSASAAPAARRRTPLRCVLAPGIGDDATTE